MKTLTRVLAALTIAAILIPEPARAEEAADPDIQDIQLQATEMTFRLKGAPSGKPLVLKSGEVYRLTIENIGKMKHEVILGRGVIENAGAATGYRELLFKDQDVNIIGYQEQKGHPGKRKFEVESRGLRELELDPGTRLSLVFTLVDASRGDWEIGCFMPGHYKSGMHLPIQVR